MICRTHGVAALSLLSAIIECNPAAAAQAFESTCAIPGTAAPPGCWRQIMPLGSGGFPASPGSHDKPLWKPGMIPITLMPHRAFDDKLWMTGQTRSYSSPDGVSWTEHAKSDWGERIYHSIVYFKGKLWMYGGMDYARRRFLNDIWSTSDGMKWSKVGTAPWSVRGGQALIVYRDKLWLLGGANRAAKDRSTDGFGNDIWVSEDGIAWVEVTPAAAWPPQDRARVAVFHGALYLVGGQNRADVWCSSDGRDWKQLAEKAAWNPRDDFALAVFDGKLWLLGGWTGRPTNALNDVWYSSDGISWSRQAEHAPWTPRDPIAIVFQDKIWIFSGKHTGGADNWGGDLWQMTATTRANP